MPRRIAREGDKTTTGCTILPNDHLFYDLSFDISGYPFKVGITSKAIGEAYTAALTPIAPNTLRLAWNHLIP